MFCAKRIAELESRIEKLEIESKIYTEQGTQPLARIIEHLLRYFKLDLRWKEGQPGTWVFKRNKK
jgi:hypothetical protein